MAIRPTQLEESFKKEVAAFEKTFDDYLSNLTVRKGQTITKSVPYGYTSAHHDILSQRYVNAGWESFIWESDQREGDFLTFKY